jgi:hypothetical protein
MASWEEIVAELQGRLEVVDQTENSIALAFSWDDGRRQQVNLQKITFAKEEIALLTSPIVPYSRESADFLMLNYAMALTRSDDGNLSIIHAIHFSHMPLEVCFAAVQAVAETADEIEKTVTDGFDAAIGAASSNSDNQEHIEETSEVFGAGQYVVGTDLTPGVYRFAGYVARLDSSLNIITNESVRSGLGLTLVSEHDAYFEVSGEAVKLEHYPSYDVLENSPRGGIYLVGVDIPAGRYRIHGEGSSAYYATYDRKMTRLSSDLNRGSLILNLQPGAYAVEFRGRLETL